MRVGSKLTRVPGSRNSVNAYAETIVNSAEPRETRMCVRKPASRSRSSRSKPIAPPRAPASARRRRTSPQPSEGIALSKHGLEGGALHLGDLVDSLGGEIEEEVEQLARERRTLGRGLYLDDATGARHDDVHVQVGRRVLRVVEVEQRLAVDDPDRDSADRI